MNKVRMSKLIYGGSCGKCESRAESCADAVRCGCGAESWMRCGRGVQMQRPHLRDVHHVQECVMYAAFVLAEVQEHMHDHVQDAAPTVSSERL